eukprot:3951461-Pyramimonas_sp.AAC.1
MPTSRNMAIKITEELEGHRGLPDSLRTQGADGNKRMKDIRPPAASLALAALEGLAMRDIGGAAKNDIKTH